WKLFLYNGSGGGVTTNLNGGWCLNISPATGHPTTVTVQASPTQAAKGASVTFTATVTSTQTVNTGTVTFTENGAPPTGAPRGGAVPVACSGHQPARHHQHSRPDAEELPRHFAGRSGLAVGWTRGHHEQDTGLLHGRRRQRRIHGFHARYDVPRWRLGRFV